VSLKSVCIRGDGKKAGPSDRTLEGRRGRAGEVYERAKERGLVAGVCNHCATVTDVADAVEGEGFDVDGTGTAALAEAGYELHTTCLCHHGGVREVSHVPLCWKTATYWFARSSCSSPYWSL